ncbi:MAG: hypothetical protein ACHQYQ_00905 [Bacteriovoracales bacterium]
MELDKRKFLIASGFVFICNFAIVIIARELWLFDIIRLTTSPLNEAGEGTIVSFWIWSFIDYLILSIGITYLLINCRPKKAIPNGLAFGFVMGLSLGIAANIAGFYAPVLQDIRIPLFFGYLIAGSLDGLIATKVYYG